MMIKKIIQSGLQTINLLRFFPKGNRFIFVFHDVSEPQEPYHSPEHYSTTLEQFKKQIAYIRRNFTLVSLSEIVSDTLPAGKNYACLTFDDGFYTVRSVVYPFLSAEQLPFALFVNKTALDLNRLWISDSVLGTFNDYWQAAKMDLRIGTVEELKNSPDFNNALSQYYGSLKDTRHKTYLGIDDLLFLQERGVEIGSHSNFHSVLSLCEDTTLQAEIVTQKSYLESALGQPITHFALPFGKKEHYNETVIRKLFASGHQYVYTTNPVGFKSANSGLIPRIGLLNQTERELQFILNRQLVKSVDI